MKKHIVFLTIFLLVSCTTNNSNLNDSTYLSSNQDEAYHYQTKISEYHLSELKENFTTEYTSQTLQVSEKSHLEDNIIEENLALITLNNTSSQNSFPNGVVLNGYDKKNSAIQYITLHSPATFDISNISLELSLWGIGDLNNVPENYFLGIEYLQDTGWIRSSSCDITKISLGNESSEVNFEIKETDVREIRIVFDFRNALGNIRFLLEKLSLEGKQFVANDNPSIEKISFKNEEVIIKKGEKLNLEPQITSSNNKFYYVNYSSSDRSVVCVNEKGEVKAINIGEAFITAKNGNKYSTIKIIVIQDEASKIIQPLTSFVGKIPEGFSANFNKFYSGVQLNFSESGNYVLTPIYSNITNSTTVILNMRLSSSVDLELSSQNIFTVEGLDINGLAIEKVQKTNLTNVEFSDIEFVFNSPDIVQYRLIFEYKHSVDQGNYYKTGKNYCLNSLVIYQK